MRSLRFQLIALTAAYAVALHALLLAFAVVSRAGATSHIGDLCSGLSASDNNSAPAGHDAACAMACAMLDGKIAAATHPDVRSIMPIVAQVLAPAIGEIPPHQSLVGPPRARAPPLA